jgi:hypothetical protein
VQIFQNAWFHRFARRERIGKSMLIAAIDQIEAGIIDADLGGNVIKQRIARPGQGKSGGYRTIIILKKGERRSLSTATLKVTAIISIPMSWTLLKKSPKSYWHSQMSRYNS